MPLSVATSGLLSAGIGGLFSAIGARRRNKEARAEARRNRAFQERMSSTAHQREVKDLRAAGLNPLLTATGGPGASSPGGSQAQIQDVLTPAVNTALAARRSGAEMALIKAQTHAAGMAGKASDALAWKLDNETNRINLERQIRQLDQDIYNEYPLMRIMQMGTAGAAVGSASALGLLKILKGFRKPPASTLFKRGKKYTGPKDLPGLRRFNQ